MSTNTTSLVHAHAPNGAIRSRVPLSLVLIAYLLPIGGALWGEISLGSKHSIAGMPENLWLSLLSLPIGDFTTGISIYLGYSYTKSGISVYSKRASTIGAIFYLVVTLFVYLWLYVQVAPTV